MIGFPGKENIILGYTSQKAAKDKNNALFVK